jgi:hypothetical protein
MNRSSLAGLLGLVLILALGLASIREASEIWAQTIVTLTLVFLFVAALAAWTGRRRDGAWRGAALFGWGYVLLAFGPGAAWFGDKLLTNAVLDIAVHSMHGDGLSPPPPPAGTPSNSANKAALQTQYPVGVQNIKMGYAREIGHASLALMSAIVGALVGQVLVSTRKARR